MFEWVETRTTERLSAGVSAIATDKQRNVCIAAAFMGCVDIGGASQTTPGNDQEAYLAKYDANANFVGWTILR